MLIKKDPQFSMRVPRIFSFVYFTSLWIDPHVYMLNIYLRVQSYTKNCFQPNLSMFFLFYFTKNRLMYNL